VVVPVLGGGGTIKEDLWLIGGASGGNAFKMSDVRRSFLKPAEGPPWTGRYKHAAAVRQRCGCKAWVYGGIDQGGNALSDLWVWKSRPNGGRVDERTSSQSIPADKVVTSTASNLQLGSNGRTPCGTFLPSGDGNLSVSRIMRWQITTRFGKPRRWGPVGAVCRRQFTCTRSTSTVSFRVDAHRRIGELRPRRVSMFCSGMKCAFWHAGTLSRCFGRVTVAVRLRSLGRWSRERPNAPLSAALTAENRHPHNADGQ
jgi:hypothetical protein